MKDLKITLIELPATVDGRLYGRLSDDVYSFVSLPSRATDLLAAIAKNAGYKDVAAMNPIFNNVKGLFTHEQLKRLVTSNVVGISTITRTARQSYELADFIKKINPETLVFMGGPHVSALPEDAIEHADVVVLNEGDRTFVELLEHVNEGRPLNSIQGIVYKNEHGDIVRTPKHPFLTNEELTALPFPVYSDDTIKGITHTVINTSRGCPYGCEYCAVIENFGQKFRFISAERTVELIEHTLAQTRKRIFFGDDNFTAIPERSKSILSTILSKGIKMPPWLAQVRVESAKDTELLELMKRAGCERVCIGFESVNEATLKAFNKSSNVEKNTFAIERFHKAGISIHGMFIIGADTDTKDSIRQTAEYAKKNRIDTAQFTYIVPLPGTKMTNRMEKAHRVISHKWHLYDGHHILVRPVSMTSAELVKASNEAWLSFYSIREAIKHLFCGNEHWFNCLVRIWGKKLARKVITQGSYYTRALASLDEWHKKAVDEYDRWSEKVERLSNDMKCSIEERREKARKELERVLQLISEKKDSYSDHFAPYKQKVLAELETIMKKRLLELSLDAV